MRGADGPFAQQQQAAVGFQILLVGAFAVVGVNGRQLGANVISLAIGEDLAKAYETDEKAVIETYDAIAAAMFHSVRLGGGPCSGLPWRWGYGYPQCPTIFD